MKATRNTPEPVAPPSTFTLELTEDEMVYLYALSYMKEGGAEFNIGGHRVLDAIAVVFPEVHGRFMELPSTGFDRQDASSLNVTWWRHDGPA